MTPEHRAAIVRAIRAETKMDISGQRRSNNFHDAGRAFRTHVGGISPDTPRARLEANRSNVRSSRGWARRTVRATRDANAAFRRSGHGVDRHRADIRSMDDAFDHVVRDRMRTNNRNQGRYQTNEEVWQAARQRRRIPRAPLPTAIR